MMVRDGTKREIFKAFQDLSKLTTTNDYVLIYYGWPWTWLKQLSL